MASERQSSSFGGLARAQIGRCPSCGRRVSAGRTCPAHGALAYAASELSAARTERAAGLSFPGYAGYRVVGQGGFGTVLRAVRQADRSIVAIKVAHGDREGAAARLSAEASALEGIGPPFVPRLLEHGCLALGEPYLVMEYIDAPTLADRLVGRATPIPARQACQLVMASLLALEAVHARGYVHRDVKPENIFVDDGYAATIIDFGLVAGLAALPGGREFTQQGAGGGTAEYMAPEQCEGREGLDERADLYAIGVILYELLAGHPPFWGRAEVVQQAHLDRRPPRLVTLAHGPTIGAPLEEIVLRCLAKDPRDRYPNAGALRADLERVAADLPSSGRETLDPDSRPSEPPPSGGERRTVGLLFFESEDDVVRVREALAPLGGQLAHGAAGRYVGLFTDEAGESPCPRALAAGRHLLRAGVSWRVRLDVARVVVHPRPDGSSRFLSPWFGRADRFPGLDSSPGLSLSPAAARLVSEPEGDGPTGEAEADTSPGPLVGRDDLIVALLESARRALAGGAATLVRVIGEAGCGKSHLGKTLGARLAEQGLDGVIELRGREPVLGGGDPTIRALLAALDLPSTAPPDGDGRPLQSLAAAPGTLQAALTVAAGEALRRRGAARPVLVILDDAHLADAVTLAALEYAAMPEGRAQIWVLALGRPAFERDQPAWGERAALRETHGLGPLAPGPAQRLCRWLLRPVDDAPDWAVAQLVERAGAVPRLLVELCRGLAREGVVRRDPRGEGWYLATDRLDRLPDLPILEWRARAELAALAPSLQAHARLIALLGEEVTEADLEGVLGRLDRRGGGAEFPLDAGVGTARLLSARVLARREGAVSFRHPLVREAVAEAVSEPQKRLIHLAAVDHFGNAGEARLEALAFHAARAGLRATAGRAYRRLAEKERARHRYYDAERLYSRALEQRGAESEPRNAGALRGRGLMRYRIGRYHDALADLAEARAIAAEAGDVATEIELLLDEATVLDWMDEYKSSEARVVRARSLAPPAPSPLLEARLLLGKGRSLHRFSRRDEATALLERAAEVAEPLGDEGYETLIIALMMLGFVHQGLGRLTRARAALDRAIALAEAHGDLLHLGSAIGNRALLWGCLGDRARMTADLEWGLVFARQLGQSKLELVGQYHLGEYLYLMDDVESAWPHVERAIAMERRRAGDAGRPVVALLEARVRLYRGEEEAARAIALRIEARQSAARDADHTDTLMVPSEEVLWGAIELGTRDATAEEWDAIEQFSARFSVGQEHLEVLEVRALAALRRGRPAEARVQLERVVALAARIPNVMSARLARWLALATRRTTEILWA